MGLMSLLMNNPGAFFLLVIPLLYSIILHEIAHGLVALWFGDKTAKYSGRLTLNPIPHLDPMGLLMLFIAGFGWAKPVPVNYTQLKNSRAGLISVSLAGCFTNIAIASLAIFLLQFQAVRANVTLSMIFSVTARINIMLAAFNLIPIPPLDGSKVVMGFLSKNTQMSFAKLEPYGFFIIIALLFTGLLSPVIHFMEGIIYGFISLLFSIF